MYRPSFIILYYDRQTHNFNDCNMRTCTKPMRNILIVNCSTNILIIKPTICTNFSNLVLEKKTLHVSDSSSVHHHEFFTVHAMVYVIQVLLTAASRIPVVVVSKTCMTYTVAVCTVKNS